MVNMQLLVRGNEIKTVDINNDLLISQLKVSFPDLDKARLI